MNYEEIKENCFTWKSERELLALTEENIVTVKAHFDTLDHDALKNELWYILDHSNSPSKCKLWRSFLLENYRELIEEMHLDNNKSRVA